MSHRPKRLIAVFLAVASSSLVAAVSGASQLQSSSSPVVADRPNVLVILTDDQRAHTMKFMPRTRHWFANGGRTYKHAFATTPLCCPSRSSIFTGLYAHNHGVETNQDAVSLDQETTMQAKLQAGHYQTYISGKYLNGWDMSTNPPHFDDWAIFGDDAGKDGYVKEDWNIGGTVVNNKPGYTTTLVGQKARQFLDESEANDDKPWLMYVYFFAPHAPHTPARKFADAPVPPWDGNPALFENTHDKPPWVQARHMSLAEARTVRKLQTRTLFSVDAQVDKLMKVLGDSGELSDTLAFYESDNGLHWGEHGLPDKRFPYLQSVEVPLMMRWPGHVQPKESSSDIAANIDIAPTALSAAGVDVSDLDGRPLTGSTPRDHILLEAWATNDHLDSQPDWAATYTPDYEYIEYYAENGDRMLREYYDLKDDPWQLHNLYGDNDPTNNPIDETLLSQTLADDRLCSTANCP